MTRLARWMAGGVVGLIGAGLVVLVVRFSWFGALVLDSDPEALPGLAIQTTIVGLVWAGCGWVVVGRAGSALGWVMIAVGLCFGLQWIGWAVWSSVRLGAEVALPWELGGAILEAAWFPAMVWVAVVLPLLFPTGRPPSGRWWWVAWAAATAFLGHLVYMAAMLAAGRYAEMYADDDPWTGVLFLLLLVGVLGSVTSMVVRFRRSGPAERQQIKWVLAALAVVGLVIFLLVFDVLGTLLGARLGPAVGFAAFGLIPVAVLAAILRYRLWDIDRIVGRTITYIVVVALLGVVYAGLVVAMGSLLPVSGDLPVAISTLAVALAFLPLVRRVQRVVDRRFFRSRYDAGVVVARVADELRGSLDLGEVTGRVEAVVDEVLAPETVGVWVAGEPS